MIYGRRCKNCNKEFTPKNKTQRYCSIECKKEYYRTTYYKETDAADRKKIVNRLYYRRNKEKINAKRRKEKRIIKCEHCGKEVETNKPNQRYCSESCRVMAWRDLNEYSKTVSRAKAKITLAKKNATRNRMEFTKEEKEFILNNRNKLTIFEIAMELKRTMASISQQLFKLTAKERERRIALELKEEDKLFFTKVKQLTI